MSYNPDLAPLGNYGGPTQTMALQDGSQAIGHGGSVHPVTDQRGVTRNAVTDIGAFQTQTVASVTVTAPAHATAGSAFLVTVTARDKNGSVVVGYTGTVTVSFTSSDGQQVYLSSAAVKLTQGVGSVMVTLDLAHTVRLTANVMSHGSDNMTLWPAANPKTSVIVTGITAGLTVSPGDRGLLRRQRSRPGDGGYPLRPYHHREGPLRQYRPRIFRPGHADQLGRPAGHPGAGRHSPDQWDCHRAGHARQG